MPGTSQRLRRAQLAGGYLDVTWPDRDHSRATGLTIDMVQDVIATALGGEMVTTTVEGLELGVVVRYPRELRTTREKLPWTSFRADHGGRTSFGQVAEVRLTMCVRDIRTENGLLAAIRSTPAGRPSAPSSCARRRWPRRSATRLLRHVERPVREHGAPRRR